VRLAVAAVVVACAAPTAPAPAVHNALVLPRDAAGLAQRADEQLGATLPPDYARPMRGAPPDFGPAIAAYRDACRAGDGRSCRRVVSLEQRIHDDRGAGLRALADRCRAGDLESCRAIPEKAPMAEDRTLAGWAGRTQACRDAGCETELRRECAGGFAASCQVLSERDVPDDDALHARTRELARAGCRADVAPECELLRSIREDAEDHLLADGHRCRWLGRDCAIYAMWLRGDPVAARETFERDCQYSTDPLVACTVLLEVYAQGRISEPIPGRVQAVRAWLCAGDRSAQPCRAP
jgi:hypothetical protein